MNDKKKHKGPGPSSKDARNARILAASANGETHTEIGKEFGLSRQTVSKICNSTQAKKFAEEQKNAIFELIPDAIGVLKKKIKDNDMWAATTVFKIAGFFIDKVENVNEKPFIVKLKSGDEIHMGHKIQGDEDGES